MCLLLDFFRARRASPPAERRRPRLWLWRGVLSASPSAGARTWPWLVGGCGACFDVIMLSLRQSAVARWVLSGRAGTSKALSVRGECAGPGTSGFAGPDAGTDGGTDGGAAASSAGPPPAPPTSPPTSPPWGAADNSRSLPATVPGPCLELPIW